jgi:trk system potassium uptake protein
MNIIIVGAGQVGASLSKNLQTEHNISLIDTNPKKLSDLQGRYDIKTVCGSGSHPNILSLAGANDADMLIAVSNNDEVNIVACQIAYSLFKTPTKMARLRNKSYARYPQIFEKDHIPIDLIINPADLVTTRLVRLVEHPGSFQVVDFADGKMQMAGASLHHRSPLVGMKLCEFRKELPDIDARIVAVYRHRKYIAITPDIKFHAHDDIFFIAAKDNLQTILLEFQPNQTRIKKVFIAGGGNIGTSLAKTLELNFSTKLIERDQSCSQKAAESLSNTIVLSGDAADTDILEAEGIDDVDLFCSVTNDDEANIMSAMLAKRMGAKSTIALVNSMSYATLIDDGRTIDRALSPQRITIGIILTYLRKGEMVNIYSLYNGICEALEAVVHGDQKSSPIIGKELGEINLPKSAVIGAIVKNNQPMIAHDDLIIEQGDRIILCISNPKDISTVEKLFQVSPTFL